MFRLAVFGCLCIAVLAQYPGYQGQPGGYSQFTTPAPRNYHPPAPVHYVNIGQQLQGDYKFGYDTGKGPLGQSFREEVRLPDGSVQGAYGILDASGRMRIVKYTAGKEGFVAQGDVGPADTPKGVAPGPAPQPPALPASHAAAAAPVYQQPAPQPAYVPRPQTYQAPAAQPRPYNPQYQEENNGPVFIDTSLLSYNIGTKG